MIDLNFGKISTLLFPILNKKTLAAQELYSNQTYF